MSKVLKKGKNFKKNKLVLVFDEAKRREFLTGFHKRKLQRKKEAKEKFENELKVERKRIKLQAKESYKKLVLSYNPIPELEKYIQQEYEEDDVNVKIIELSSNSAEQNADCSVKSDEENINEDEIFGMEIKGRSTNLKDASKKIDTMTKKDVKKALKKESTKTIKKSKIFQKKNELEKIKARKKALKVKKQKNKFHKKSKNHNK